MEMVKSKTRSNSSKCYTREAISGRRRSWNNLYMYETLRSEVQCLYENSCKKKNMLMANLFEGDVMSPLPQAYDNNLVQICPKHATHDIVPAAKRNTLAT